MESLKLFRVHATLSKTEATVEVYEWTATKCQKVYVALSPSGEVTRNVRIESLMNMETAHQQNTTLIQYSTWCLADQVDEAKSRLVMEIRRTLMKHISSVYGLQSMFNSVFLPKLCELHENRGLENG